MSNYRPKDWDNPHLWVDEDGFDKWGEHYEAYEAGADAMLEGLGAIRDRLTVTSDAVTLTIAPLCEGSREGTWYFIPDEEG